MTFDKYTIGSNAFPFEDQFVADEIDGRQLRVNMNQISKQYFDSYLKTYLFECAPEKKVLDNCTKQINKKIEDTKVTS